MIQLYHCDKCSQEGADLIKTIEDIISGSVNPIVQEKSYQYEKIS